MASHHTANLPLSQAGTQISAIGESVRKLWAWLKEHRGIVLSILLIIYLFVSIGMVIWMGSLPASSEPDQNFDPYHVSPLPHPP